MPTPNHYNNNRMNIRLSGHTLTAYEYKPSYVFKDQDNKQKSASRAKRTLKDKINGTFPTLYRENRKLFKQGWRTRFLTLTFDGEPPTHKEVYRKFHAFQKRLKRRIAQISVNHSLKSSFDRLYYIAVKERGVKTGRLHLHIIIFSPYFNHSEWLNMWQSGGVWIEKIRELENNVNASIPNLYSYLVKYFSKGFDAQEQGESSQLFPQDKDLDMGKKRFFSSRNVKKQVTLIKCIDLNTIEDVIDSLPSYVKTKIYEQGALTVLSGSFPISIPIKDIKDFLRTTYQTKTSQTELVENLIETPLIR